jgi:potassium channel subfamily K, other eukaryote
MVILLHSHRSEAFTGWRKLRPLTIRIVDLLPRNSPRIVSEARIVSKDRFRLSSSNNKKKDQHNNDPDIVGRYLRSFWKGISLPFPALRALLYPSPRESKISVGISTKEGIAVLLAYLTTGVLAYTFVFEQWSIVDSIYFTTTVFSTVGYGDLSPTNMPSRIFTCLFGFGGIGFLGSAIATIGSSVVHAEVEAVTTAQRESQKRLMQMFEGMPKVLDIFRGRPHEEQKESLLASREQGTRRSVEVSPPWPIVVGNSILRALPPCSIVFGGGAIMRHLNGDRWTWPESFYYALVTGALWT